ncbi:MAG: hypothetical protein JO018_03965 [Candidatus Eremiobacteraeota bacterium]|nr:hypothetical protein [Candidatus Eremiobacteraeota bacterium]
MEHGLTENRYNTMSGSTNGGGGAESAASAAQSVSNPLEYGVAKEPVNSTWRTVLLGLAGASIVGSLLFQLMGRKHEALFVGEWAPTFLIIALWGQLVKAQEQSL